MNELMMDNRFLLGMGLLNSNQASLQPTSPYGGILNSLATGNQMKQQLTANDRANEMHELRKLQINQQLNAAPERKIITGNDGFNYYQDDGSRVLPNVTAKPEKVTIPSAILEYQYAVKNDGFKGTFQDWETAMANAKASKTNINMPAIESAMDEPLDVSDLASFRDKEGNPPKNIMTPRQLEAAGFSMIDKRKEDTQKAFNEKWAEDVKTYDTMSASINSYKEILGKTGTKIIPDADKLRLKAEYTNMLMGAKDLFELGVLTGPDMDLLQSVAEDPTSLLGNYVGKEALIEQLDAIENKVNSSKSIAAKAYGQKTQAKPLSDDERAELEVLKAELIQ